MIGVIMNGARVNPLKHDALTADSEELRPGVLIKFWRPGDTSSVQEGVKVLSEVLSEPYLDNEEDLVIELQLADGKKVTRPTSDVGLSGDRTTGEWHMIAILDDGED